MDFVCIGTIAEVNPLLQEVENWDNRGRTREDGRFLCLVRLVEIFPLLKVLDIRASDSVASSYVVGPEPAPC